MIADIATLQVEAGRLLTYRAADACDRGLPYAKEAAMAKLFTSETANKVAYLALQIHGGYGYSTEYTIERIYRDARVSLDLRGNLGDPADRHRPEAAERDPDGKIR